MTIESRITALEAEVVKDAAAGDHRGYTMNSHRAEDLQEVLDRILLLEARLDALEAP